MIVKVCTKCNELKPIELFSKDKTLKSGFRASCKKCNSSSFNKWYTNNLSKMRERNAKRMDQMKKNPDILAKYREKTKASARRSIQRHPERQQARMAVKKAIRHGKLVRPSVCSVCGCCCKPEAHHDSYLPENHLNIRWMCSKCHDSFHLKYPETV